MKRGKPASPPGLTRKEPGGKLHITGQAEERWSRRSGVPAALGVAAGYVLVYLIGRLLWCLPEYGSANPLGTFLYGMPRGQWSYP